MKEKIKSILIYAISLLVVVAITLCGILTFNYVKVNKSSVGTVDNFNTENVVVDTENSTSSGGLTLLSSTMSETSEKYGRNATYTLTVSYNESALYPSFTWTSTDNTHITLTPSSDTFSCTVVCNSAFSTQITITCTADDNANAYATCKVDYYKSLIDGSFSFYDDLGNTVSWTTTDVKQTYSIPEWTSDTYSSNYCYYGTFTPSSYGTGTITESYTITSVYAYNFPAVYSSAFSTSTCKLQLASFATIIKDTAVTKSLVKQVYNSLVTQHDAYASSSDSAYGLQLAVEGKNSGYLYFLNYYMDIDPDSFYTAVSSASLSQTNLYF